MHVKKRIRRNSNFLSDYQLKQRGGYKRRCNRIDTEEELIEDNASAKADSKVGDAHPEQCRNGATSQYKKRVKVARQQLKNENNNTSGYLNEEFNDAQCTATNMNAQDANINLEAQQRSNEYVVSQRARSNSMDSFSQRTRSNSTDSLQPKMKYSAPINPHFSMSSNQNQFIDENVDNISIMSTHSMNQNNFTSTFNSPENRHSDYSFKDSEKSNSVIPGEQFKLHASQQRQGYNIHVNNNYQLPPPPLGPESNIVNNRTSAEEDVNSSWNSQIIQSDKSEVVYISHTQSQDMEDTNPNDEQLCLYMTKQQQINRLKMRQMEAQPHPPEAPVILGKGGPMNSSFKELVESIYHLHKEKEKLFLPKANYLQEIQVGTLTPKMRSILIDWLCEVNQEFRFNNHTFHLAVNYLDRFLSSARICEEKLQLCGIVSLLLAAKYNERIPPCIDDYIYITDFAYKRTDFLKTESLILNSLEFRLSVATQLDYIHHYILMYVRKYEVEASTNLHNPQMESGIVQDSLPPNHQKSIYNSMQISTTTQQVKNHPSSMANQSSIYHKEALINQIISLSTYLSEIAQLDYDLLKYSYSMRSASAVVIAMQTIGYPDLTPEIVNEITDFKFETLQSCIFDMHALQVKLHFKSDFVAIRSKFSNSQNYYVARQRPLESIHHFSLFHKFNKKSVQEDEQTSLLQVSRNEQIQLTPVKSNVGKFISHVTPQKIVHQSIYDI